MKIKKQKTKTLVTKLNNNSSNCIAPNILYGCAGNCQYCYMHRYNPDNLYINTNVDQIFQSVVEWEKTFTKFPDQQDPKYVMVDIACNSDLVLHQKHMPEPLFDYIKRYDDHPTLNSTMATKFPSMLTLDVSSFNKKPRVRVSLMPQIHSDILEPKMQSIDSRIQDINRLKNLGWEVHINYSPIVFFGKWQDDYHNLFNKVMWSAGINKCEMIAMTNHKFQMERSTEKAKVLMQEVSEIKNKQGVMRYPLNVKQNYLRELKQIYSNYFPLETIRYIF